MESNSGSKDLLLKGAFLKIGDGIGCMLQTQFLLVASREPKPPNLIMDYFEGVKPPKQANA